MWPRMLFDLVPHLARLVPMADKYLGSRSASEKTQQAALSALAENVGGQLGRVTEGYAGIDRQLREQGAQAAQVAVEVTRTRMGIESVEARVARLEKSAGAVMKLLVLLLVVLVMSTGTLIVLAVLLLRR